MPISAHILVTKLMIYHLQILLQYLSLVQHSIANFARVLLKLQLRSVFSFLPSIQCFIAVSFYILFLSGLFSLLQVRARLEGTLCHLSFQMKVIFLCLEDFDPLLDY